ncbi:MAG: CocE/NonD family hydrolase [Synechococcaceae cyanobacterium]|nr:CocE/NonD family hydrolase [Synechococcaceae cyanobacterium]
MTGQRELWMPCADGVRLATRLWIPEGAGPWPVLLMRQPYGRAIASTVTYAHPGWYAGNGFLVAIQDVRGRGGSEGRFGGFAQEAADGAAAVRWARRLPDSNGRVGLYGFSYQGLSQLLNTAATADDGDDPLPDCLAPALCGLDERLHWATEGGAHWWGIGLGWALQLAAQGCRHRGDGEGWLEIRRSLESGEFLREGPTLLERHDPGGMGLEWLRRDPAAARGWRRHAPPEALWRRPLLLLGGWQDPHLRGTLDLWRRARRAGGDPWLRIGAWTHLDWDGGIDALQLAFFRAHLGNPAATEAAGVCGRRPEPAKPGDAEGRGNPGEPAGTEPMGADPTGMAPAGMDPAGTEVDPLDLRWRCALQVGPGGPWRTPAAAERHQWQLGSEGLAATRDDEGWLRTDRPGRGTLTFVHDPWRPVPGRGGHLGLEAGWCTRGDLDRRSDVACFQTAPLPEPLRLQGQPQLRLTVAADQPGFDLCAALSVLEPQGEVRQVSTGVARFLGEHCRQPRPRRLALQPLLLQLQAGQRLRLSLAGSAWPQIAVNPGSGARPWGGVSSDHREISLTLSLAGAHLWIAPLFGAN